MLIYLFIMYNKPAPGAYHLLLCCPDTDAYLQFAFNVQKANSMLLISCVILDCCFASLEYFNRFGVRVFVCALHFLYCHH